jgi:uncharacterized protein (TIGR02145 family)
MKVKGLAFGILVMIIANPGVLQAAEGTKIKGKMKVKRELSLTDARDGQKYKIVKIGSQTWMAQNLNYATGSSECYDNKEENCSKYGRLYDWETAQKACPSGWHLPTRKEFDTLWALPAKELRSRDFEGTNGTGFSALPSGARMYEIKVFNNPSTWIKGDFRGLGIEAHFWSSDDYKNYGYDIDNKSTGYSASGHWLLELSVRCLKD